MCFSPHKGRSQEGEKGNFQLLFDKGKAFAQQQKEDSALYYFNESLKVTSQSVDSAKSITEIAWIAYFSRRIDEAVDWAHFVMQMDTLNTDPEFRKIKSDIVGIPRAKYYFAGDFEKAHYYSLFQKDILELDSINHFGLIRVYINLSTEAWSMKRYEEALDYAEKSLLRIKNEEDSPGVSSAKVRAYIMIGLILTDTQNYDRAHEYNQYALEMLGEPNSENFRNYLSVLNNIANYYKIKKEHGKALEYYLKADNVLEANKGRAGYANYKLILLHNLGDINTEMGRLKEGERQLRQSLTVIDSYQLHDHISAAITHSYLAQNLVLNGQEEEALKHINNAIAIALKSEGVFGRPITKYYFMKAEILHGLGKPEAAQQSLLNSFRSNSTIEIDGSTLYSDPTIAFMGTKMKLEMLKNHEAGGFTPMDSIIRLYDHIIDQAVQSYAQGTEDSDKISNVFSKFFEVSWPIYTANKGQQLLNILWQLSENDKSRQLMAHLNDKMAIENTIPEEFRRRRLAIQDSIEYYQTIDLRDSATFKETILDLKSEARVLKNEIENAYPEYHKLKYQQQVIGLEELSELAVLKNRLFIEYYLKDSLLFATSVDNGVSKMIRIEVDSSFYESLNAFNHSIKNPFSKGSKEVYLKTGYYLYRTLISPLIEKTAHQEILIIPSGPLGLIPFEALLSEEVNPIDDIEFNNNDNANTKVLAIAPIFEGPNQLDSIRNGLGNLDYTKEESQKIAQYFSTTVLKDAKAVESEFNKIAGDYGIIHIASHALVDGADPMYSKIVFTQDKSDSLDDGFLHAFELLNNNLNAEMAVLSACNTGYGQIEQGEGVMSLAQAFFYSGAKSVVMSLWPANDYSTAEVMDKFYRYLSQGESKSEALRKAKLEYLESSDNIKSHPYYWAQFIANGDMRPLTKPADYTLYLGLVALGILIMIMVRRRKIRHS